MEKENTIPKYIKREIKNMPPKRIKVLIGGPSKIGKSTFFDGLSGKVLFINTDGNTAGYSQPFIKIESQKQTLPSGREVLVSSWEYFKSILNDLLAQDKKGELEYDWVVIDLLSELFDMCEKYVCEQKGIEDSTANFYRGRTLATKEFLSVMRTFYKDLSCNLGTILLHQLKNVFDKTGKEIIEVKNDFNLHDSAFITVDGLQDLTARIYSVEEQGKEFRVFDWNKFGVKKTPDQSGGYRFEHLWPVEVDNPSKIILLDPKAFEKVFLDKK